MNFFRALLIDDADGHVVSAYLCLNEGRVDCGGTDNRVVCAGYVEAART